MWHEGGVYTDIDTTVSLHPGRWIGEELGALAFITSRKPTLFGDVLLFPIDGFAAGREHSRSGQPEYGEKLVWHHFGSTWYDPEERRS